MRCKSVTKLKVKNDITIKGGPPYNNRFNPTQRGRHALCSGGSFGLVLRQRSRRNPHSSVLSRPAEWGPQLRGLIERYTDGVCHEDSRRDSVMDISEYRTAQEMGVGPPDSDCRIRIQTTSCCFR